MKAIKAVICGLVMMAGPACTEDVLRHTYVSCTEGDGTCEVSVNISARAERPEVKSSLGVSETAVNDITLIVYRDGLLCVNEFWSDPGAGMSVKLVLGQVYHVYAIANTGSLFEAPVLESMLPDCTLAVNNSTLETVGMPMASLCNTLTPSGSSPSVVLSLKRLFARLTFGADRSALGGATLSFTSVKICQAAACLRPFADESKASESAEVQDGDELSAADLTSINSGGTAVFYIPENCQGTLLGSNTDPWQKVPSSIGEAGALCTYIEAVSDYSDLSEEGSVTYRFYLGGDNCTNFDIARNTDYTVTLIPGDDPGSVSSWKLDADLSSAVELSIVKTDDASDDYVGYLQTFELQGLQAGETVSSAVINGVNEVTHAMVSGTSMTYVPYYTWQLLKVTTSSGRVVQKVISAIMPKLIVPQYVNLNVDGTSVLPCIRYGDPTTDAVLTGFDTSFYDSYLKAKTFTLVNTYSSLIGGNDYVKLTSGTYTHNSAMDGSGASGEGSLFAYKVNVSGWSYNSDVATVSVKNPKFSSMAAQTMRVRILSPIAGVTEQNFGKLNDWSMIPANGEMDMDYLSDNGFSTDDSRDVTWSLSGVVLNVDEANLYGPQISSGTITNVVKSGNNYSFKITSDHSYSRPSVFFKIKNIKSDVYAYNNAKIGYVEGYLHLCVGAVRTSLTSNGAYSSKWKAAGAFAKPSGGLSGFAAVVASAFKTGGSYQKCVYVRAAGPIVTYPQGSGGVKQTIYTEDSTYGTEADLYSVEYENTSGYYYYPQTHYDSQTPFIALYNYRSDGMLGTIASGPVEYSGTGVYVHNYGDVYPDSKGWLTPSTSTYQISY